MLRRGHGGTIIFTGASASVKGYAKSAPFAMGKFALRGLAREHGARAAAAEHPCRPRRDRRRHRRAGPRGDGGAARPDGMLLPDAIAENFLHLHRQHRSAWSWEIAVRPWVENF